LGWRLVIGFRKAFVGRPDGEHRVAEIELWEDQ